MQRTGSEPRLSIVLPTRNRAVLFERSLASIIRVADAEFPDTEIIVIDGGSTDETIEVLKRFSDRLTYWVSEPDTGVAEAVNKGIAQARGGIIRLVGDDDEFVPGGLSQIVSFMDSHPEYDLVAGHNEIWVEEPDGGRVMVEQRKFTEEVTLTAFKKWGKPNILIPEVCFFRRRAFEKAGVYDTTLKWWGFLDLFFRMLQSGVRIYVLPVTILRTYQTVVSDTRSNLSNPAFQKEFSRVIKTRAGLTWHWWHSLDGTLNPTKIARSLAVRACARIGFHPRRLIRTWLHHS